MMISPECYYEFDLKEKNADQIMTEIRRLKRTIGRLKDTMEHPDYSHQIHCCPSEDVQLRYTHLYLEKAKIALAEVGGAYRPTKAEQKTAAFEASIPSIRKLTFTIGGFHSGFETRTITLDDQHLYLNIDHSLFSDPSNLYIEPDFPISRETLLDGIRDLHIGEWRSSYNTRRFGIEVLDGTQWELTIEFSDGHKPVKFCGDNAYPYNFNELQMLLGIDFDDDPTE